MFDVPADGEDDNPENASAYRKYVWFYSIYSLPNMILPFFGGFFIDKLGVRIGCFLFSLLLLIGQTLCWLSGELSGLNLFILKFA